MADGLLHGGRSQLEVLFDELAEELRADGASLEILMVGGSWLLWFDERHATRDVDSGSRISPRAAQAVARVADRHDLDSDWVNGRATAFLPADFDSTSVSTVFDRESLTVLIPPADTIFLMKLSRASAQDREDMILLWKRCTFGTAEAVVAAYEAAYPHEEEDPGLAGYVAGIIGLAEE